MFKKQITAAAVLSLLFVIHGLAQQWRPVSGSRQANISGMALIDHQKQRTTFIVVHDNKKKEQSHAGILTVEGAAAPKLTPLTWQGDDIPVDLEAVTSIPNIPGQFIAFTAAGRVYHIKLDLTKNTVALIKSFDVPMIPSEADFEGFALQTVNNTLIATWAERGSTAKPATIFWSKFDLATDTFSTVRTAAFQVPYPAADVRHISDIKMDASGGVFVVAASDPGNDGPFSSAFYFAGVFDVTKDQQISFSKSTVLTRLNTFDYHKVEAFEFVPGPDGGVVFGTDDENLGAAVCLDF